MSTPTIPAARLREQAEFSIRMLSHAAHAYARLLRANHIDWLSANSNINEMRAQAQIVSNALSIVVFDIPAERAEIQRMHQEFDAAMNDLQTDLRANCLLNGPTQRAI